MARISTGKDSKQDYGTPLAFIEAVHKRFGAPVFDLAATSQNTKAPKFFSAKDDALGRPWNKIEGLQWLNPPFRDLEPWTKKCVREQSRGANILALLPLTLSETFRLDVIPYADIYFLEGRIKFDGATHGLTRDCILAHYRHARWKDYELNYVRGLEHITTSIERLTYGFDIVAPTKHYLWKWKLA